MASSGLRTGIQLGLAVVILGLSYLLYVSLTAPYEKIERQRELTEQARSRMQMVRTALMRYERTYDRFPGSLDTLKFYLRDSLSAAERDSLFERSLPPIDTLLVSPRTNQRFDYALNEEEGVPTYLLEDPGTDDRIGTLTGDPTEANVASWE
jgi:hypothetical protein